MKVWNVEEIGIEFEKEVLPMLEDAVCEQFGLKKGLINLHIFNIFKNDEKNSFRLVVKSFRNLGDYNPALKSLFKNCHVETFACTFIARDDDSWFVSSDVMLAYDTHYTGSNGVIFARFKYSSTGWFSYAKCGKELD